MSIRSALVASAIAAVLACVSTACSDQASAPNATPAVGTDLETATAHSQGLDGPTLVGLAHWIRDTPGLPIFSILISRHDKLVFELYTGGIERPQAHYMMSVSKSVLSSLVGAALKTGAIKSLDTPISQLLSRSLFASDADASRFSGIRLQHVMGMSALNVSDPPRDTSAAAGRHQSDFVGAANRVAFALTEPLLAAPGRDFLYNDETPLLAAGVVQYATGKTLLDFGRAALFDSLGFVNEEWMHQDRSGIDMGGYGFRMRPMDMQKLGLLYLHGGSWKGQQLLPADWIAKAYVPYIKSDAFRTSNNYGWYWWTYDYGTSWRLLVADGWKGQRIAVNPDHDLVVTMTAYIETQNEVDVFYQLMTQFVMPAVTKGSSGDIQAAIDAAIAEVHAGKSRVKTNAETRMIPSVSPKEQPIPFRP